MPADADDLAGVRAAVDGYERALATNDLVELDRWFHDDPATIRVDARDTLVGHAAISAFRAGRGGAPARVVDRLHLTPAGPGCVVAIAETRRFDGARGLQSQTWLRTPAGWRIVAAHLSTAPASADPVWRLRGTPLVAGAPGGPLAGLTVAVKDLFAVAGYRVGAGNPTWLAEAPVETISAVAVAALLAGGADVAGIAQTEEFGYGLAGTNAHYGAPANPAAPGRVPGGSSSGPASAVAQGLVDVGLGTDTAGSIRVPASYQGLFALRPTHGAVDTAGMTALAPSFDTVGWLTRDARTLARVGNLLLPPGPAPAPVPVRRLLVAADVQAAVDHEVDRSVRAGTSALAAATGAAVEPVDQVAHGSLGDWARAFRTEQAAQAHERHGAWVAAHPGCLGAEIAERFAWAAAVSPADRAWASEVVTAARAALRSLLTPGTVLALAASAGPAPALDASPDERAAARSATVTLTALASLAGLPAVVLPGPAVDGRPLGLCLVGAPGTDRDLLRLLGARADRATRR